MVLARHPQPILFRAQPMRPGEVRARLDLAESLAREGAVMLAWGGMQYEGKLPAGVTLTLLPPAWEDPRSPGLMLDQGGAPVGHAWKKRRAAALLALFAGMAPHQIVLDGVVPLFRFELRPLLEMARRRDPPPAVRVWPEGALVDSELSGLTDGFYTAPSGWNM